MEGEETQRRETQRQNLLFSPEGLIGKLSVFEFVI